MKLIHRITLFAFASAILMVALGGAAHAQAPIKIGASLSTTGSFAALAAGCDGFKTKPSDFEGLVAKIRSLPSRSAKP